MEWQLAHNSRGNLKFAIVSLSSTVASSSQSIALHSHARCSSRCQYALGKLLGTHRLHWYSQAEGHHWFCSSVSPLCSRFVLTETPFDPSSDTTKLHFPVRIYILLLYPNQLSVLLFIIHLPSDEYWNTPYHAVNFSLCGWNPVPSTITFVLFVASQ